MSETPQPLYWEDVQVGDALPTLEVTIGAAQLFQLSAVMHLAHRIHFDLDWARHEGYPHCVIHAPFHGEVLVQMVRNWAGIGSWMRRFNYQNRNYAVLGDTLRGEGTVTAKHQDQGYSLVDLELAVTKATEGGRVTTAPGGATLALPTRSAPVPIPS